jgi:hypothetical protein
MLTAREEKGLRQYLKMIFVLVERIGPAGAFVARVAGVAMIAVGALI